MPTRRAHDHIGNRNFKIEIAGMNQGTFAECSGVEVDVEVIEFQDGDDMILRKRPGRASVANVVLKRGYLNTTDLWDWMKLVLEGKVERRDMSIILLDEAGGEISRYNLFEAWPCRWKGFEFDAGGVGVSVEELEIAVEKAERA